ncbi:DUF488 family protein [Pelagibius sp.]|uniref:DUF488 domain-containing protein n=1 Tax=Pelagibius sp. TaxID=1931238 RepID=UPI00260AFCC1|nr:DUF488 domain-containing protein [Pelagibius sp.]
MTEFATIGYEGADIDDFIAVLHAARISLLVDVRELPISRRRGFAKTALSSALAEAGIQYLHLRGLGDPKPGRDAARAGNLREFRQIFAKHMRSEEARTDLEKLKAQLAQERVCLMCFERDPSNCHRSIVASMISDSMESKVIHLWVNKDATRVGQRSGSGKSPSAGEGVAACGR